ncbi:VOC family protein [Galbitalea soli]|uniref:VOC family protein n=1 Tax=Galbitalea soli TaxID=1268042 RepID=A0A7C9PML3_9MICO|nr:VOC family protein [Galbitalea soli]NEM91054.1 VOC family protein [Galbitalea soli]NYJ29742.1 catechol 2,3-dioxygenase-like lactoylglutathione lyase family enzyme [Galbitalea soli]
MAGKLGNITIDCADPQLLSDFWADVFGYPRAELPPAIEAAHRDGALTDDQLASRGVAQDPAGIGPRFFFQRVPESKVVKNRVHVDVMATPGRRPSEEELVAERDRIVALGATVVREVDEMWGPFPDRHVVMQDPEGNEFCLQ